MSKKIILSIILLTAIVLSFNCVFAENMAQDAANTVNDSIDKTQNTMNNAGNAIKDAGNSAMNAVNSTVNGAMNTVNELTQDRNTSNTDNNNMNMAGTNDNANYTTTRTSAEGTILGMNSTAWTWLIMGAVAIAIVALIWYYAMQTSDHGYDDE
ncbi:MAG: hypothetical protein IKF83_01825 [Clostridia bacterium]|nr:hypothetical protein [Clostridia bacterium]